MRLPCRYRRPLSFGSVIPGGGVLVALRRLVAAWAAALISSLAFMAFHVIDLAMFFPGRFLTLALPLAVCVGIGGAAWCWLYQRTGSLYAPWLSHLVMDAAIFAVGYDLAFVQAR